jgi:hypothetical protein
MRVDGRLDRVTGDFFVSEFMPVLLADIRP